MLKRHDRRRTKQVNARQAPRQDKTTRQQDKDNKSRQTRQRQEDKDKKNKITNEIKVLFYLSCV
jgi:hypothetical protein